MLRISGQKERRSLELPPETHAKSLKRGAGARELLAEAHAKPLNRGVGARKWQAR
jgi:hypothetical protein